MSDNEDRPDGYQRIVSLKLVIGTDSEVVTRCDECPMFRDPDPYPSYCSLDPEHGNYALSTKSVDCLGPFIPDNCPLAGFRVEVTRAATEGT